MMKQFYVLCSMLLLLCVGASAQSTELLASATKTSHNDDLNVREQAHPVSGTVTDENGEPFIGATVAVEGTTIGTITNAEGRYNLEAPNGNSRLIISFVGYATQEINISNRTVIDVQMETDVVALSEVVVTALGIEKESKKLGYSVTSVNTDEMIENRTTNPMESLVGKVAGLNITPPAAGAGSSTQIRLRGQTAFAGATNSPLIVINGLPIDQGARGASGGGQTRDRGDNLNNVNPDDIESMTVLKGATAAALYGARAANGAIVITTKSGKLNQGIGVEWTSNYSVQEALNFYDFQTEYGQGTGGNRPGSQGQAQSSGQFAWGERLDGVPTPIFDGTLAPYSANPNRLFDFLQNGTNFTNTIALSGGGANGSFRVSFSNTDSEGITPTNEYNRKIANVGINHNITKKLRLQLNVNYTNENQINPPQIGVQGPGAVNFLTRIATSIPLSALKNSAVDPATGTENQTSGFQGTLLNPYYRIQAGQLYDQTRNRLLATATLRYNFTDWLYLQGRYNYDIANTFTEQVNPGGIGTSVPVNGDGTYKGSWSFGESYGTDINADFLLGVNKEFGVFSVDASLGGNTFRVENHNTNVSASNFILRDLYFLGNGSVLNQGFGYSQRRINSLYGIAEFGYNGMLYLNFTGRNDWFSVLNPQNNSIFYPSVSGSFIFSEILPDASSWLDYGKLRASWAQVGSEGGVGPYQGILTYNINAQNDAFLGQQTTANISGGTAPNPFLQPFTVTEKEIGVDMRLFNNRLHVDIGAFEKVTTDQILSVALSNTSGWTSSQENRGSLKNSGLETLIEVVAVETGDFNWTSSWNNAYLSTEVLEVGEDVDNIIVVNWGATGLEFIGQLRYVEGMPMNQIYARTYRRDDQGRILLRDDGRLLPSDDYVPYGSSIPKFTGGWTNSFSYKNLSVGIHIDYKLGGYVISSTALNANRQGHSKKSLDGRREGENGVVFPGFYESSGEPNTQPVDPAVFFADYRNNQMGDIVTFKSDFVKLRNVSVSYDFTDLARNAGFLGFVKGLRLSASVRNLALLYSDLPDLDPEAVQSSGDTRTGYENTSLPTTRNYNFTLNARF